MHKIMISAGEASGDLNGARVAEALRQLEPDIRLFGMGGKAMQAAGVEIVYDIADLGVMGLVEVVKSLPKLFALRDRLAGVMDQERPDVLVVIDYPGFNTRLAKAAKARGIPIVYYISPSAWAWGKGRAKEIAGLVSRIAAIFPFEAEVYREAGANVTFVGHPLLDIVQPAMSKQEAYAHFGADPARPVLLLMPGSRRQEIEKLLPVMLAASEKILREVPDCQFFLPIASTISREMLQNKIEQYRVPVQLTTDNTYDLMHIADGAIAASGTATLEAALMQVPTVIIYKTAALTAFLARFLVKIPHIGLPNIVAGRRIVPELLQNDANPENIARETLAILGQEKCQKRVRQDLTEVRNKLGQTGAVGRVAGVILEVAEEARDEK
ncbi:lipid-a-disaccharide synthetase [Lucifera butyrica]|uniref:Lipid-A-disaccharide synthase n=1 Tax=Lucifera butyrica TaxID=1351585 RepID=A0A498RGR6_9FIRM|nr:lipid-A-disaccharide synthase [Lucifera butyrica]VBB09272.1 lipid-a-disaccharide synthetase [Lucifera butyrica]